jgi:hypothetical protein
MNRLQNLPEELTLHVHSFHDTFRQDFQQKVLPTLQDCVRKKLLKKAFDLLSKVQVQEAYDFMMDDNQFNYELVKEEPMLYDFDTTWFMNHIRINKCWGK